MASPEKNYLSVESLNKAVDTMTLRGLIVEDVIRAENPELLDIFMTYQNEAIAARKFIHGSLSKLKPGDEILEVGGGIQALAIQLASEGFKITSVEPASESFNSIKPILKLFSEKQENTNNYHLIQKPIEECEFKKKFDFIFSINVMEHLLNPYSVILQLVDCLNHNGIYRFFCPNYDFPYEPHFGKWLWSRKNQAFFLKSSRAKNLRLRSEDQIELYNSINFITVNKVRKFCNSKNLVAFVDNEALPRLVQRSLTDLGLRSRHLHLVKFIESLNSLGLLGLAKIVPSRFQPIMDISLTKEILSKI